MRTATVRGQVRQGQAPDASIAANPQPDNHGRRPIGHHVRFLPIIFFELYLLGTVLLFAFGPWPYPVSDPWKLYTFLALAQIALLAGYIGGAVKRPRGYRGPWKIRRIFLVSVLVSLILLPFTSLYRTGSLIPDVKMGLVDPGTAYAEHGFLAATGRSAAPIIEYVRILFGPLLVLTLPLLVFYWSRLARWMRIFGVISVIGGVAVFVAMGTNKGIFDVALLTPCLVVAGAVSGVLRITRRMRVAGLIAAVALVGLAILFFGKAISGRLAGAANPLYSPAIGISADLDNPLVKVFPPGLQSTAVHLVDYLSQGYYGLGLALDEPFIPMFGVGNSTFLYRQAARLLADDAILDAPYPVRLSKYGWDGYGHWSTIYPWLASDVSFPGTIVIVFLIGWVFALSWLDTLRAENPFAVAVFAQFVIMLFYFSANNQLLQSGADLTAFYVTLLLWFVTRKRVAVSGEAVR